MNSELVPLKTFPFRHGAEQAQQLLQASGIASTVGGDDAAGWAPHLGLAAGGITLFVSEADLTEARQVLAESET